MNRAAPQVRSVSPASDPGAAQRRAADPGRSVWVGASAGSGKTTVLTARLLRLLLPREDGAPGSTPNRILCLTFTRAAAREMAVRLYRRLSNWASWDEDKLRADLGHLLGREPSTGDMRAARRLFATVTDAPGGLRIMTIHAFCQSVLGRFPVEAGLLPGFTALDETQAAELRNQARDAVLSAAGGDPESALGQALSLIAQQVGLDDLGALLGAILSQYRQLEHLLHAEDFSQSLRPRLATAFGLEEEEDEHAILAAAFAADAFEETAIRAAAAAMAQNGGKRDPERGTALLGWLDHDAATRAAKREIYERVFLTGEGEVRVDIMTKGLAARHPDHEAALRREAERLRAVLDRLRATRCAALTQALLQLGIAVWRKYEAAKAARGALDFDDMINRTLDLLGQPGIAPWVMYKLDGGLDHILIDEAQDTNPAQWEVVKKLTSDFFTGMGAREDVRPTVFAVGDEKQSIYSFQGARPEKFYDTRSYFSAIVRHPDIWWEEPLHTSFRTVPSVLRFVDEVFNDDSLREGVSAEVVRHLSNRAGEAGLVELWPLFATPDREDRAPFDPPLAPVESRSGAARLAEHIGVQIKSWLENGEFLPARGRAMQAGDILILVRRRSAFVGQLIRALKTRGVPVSGVDRMVLKDQLAVQDLMAAAQFALLPQDDLTLACLLKSPLIGWDDARLEKVAIGRAGSLWAAVSAGDDLPLRGWLDALIAAGARDRPYEFFSRLLEAPCPADAKSGLHAMSARLGPEALDPLQEFLNAALAAERDAVPSLQTFLLAMAQGDSDIKREQEEAGNTVRIMTIHGAKGLEAPVVILPDTVRATRRPAGMDVQRLIWPDRSGHDVPVWSPRVDTDCAVYATLLARLDEAQEAEYRRLLYVALTRAADRLYIAGHTGRRQTSTPSWYDYMAAAMQRLEDAESVPFDSPHFYQAPDASPPVLHRLQNPQTAAAKEDRKSDGTLPAPAYLPAWLYAPAPAEPEPTYPLTPSRPAAEPAAQSPLAPADPHRFRRGIVTHRLLQFLPDLAPERRAAQAERFLERHAADLPEETRRSIRRETLAILGNPEWAPLFGPDSLAEISITGNADGRLVSGQIDRLYLAPDAVWIVDYKTNRPPPATPESIPAVYRAQMKAYRDIVAAIYRGRAVRCFLLWTDGPALMPVD